MQITPFSFIVMWLCVIAVGNVSRLINSPADGTEFKDVPSHLYIQNDTSDDAIHTGELLLSVNGRSVSYLEELETILQNVPKASSIVELEVFHPAKELKRTVRVSQTILSKRFVRELPPAVYIAKVFKGGPAERSGIQQGDIIIRINGQEFTEPMGFSPLMWLQSLSTPVKYAVAADRILHRAGLGSNVPFEILRDNQNLIFQVTLSKFGISSLVYIVFGFVIIGIFLFNPQIAIYKLGRFILFLGFLFLAFNRDASTDLLTILVYITMFATLSLIFIPLGSWWFKPIFSSSIFSSIQTPHFLPCVFIATLIFGILYVWHIQIPSSDDTQDYVSMRGKASGAEFFTITSLRHRLFNRGPIPLAIGWTFFFGITYLFFIWLTKYQPLRPTQKLNSTIFAAAHAGDIDKMVAAVNDQIQSGQVGYYGLRVHQLAERLNRDPDHSTLMSLRNEILTHDEEDASFVFVPVTWCEYALPILGFIGTIVGISVAMDAIANAIILFFGGEASRQDVIPDLTRGFQGLALAFDTTFFGLIGVLVLSLIDRSLKKRIATQLAAARELLGHIVLQWRASSAVGELGALNLRLLIAEGELEQSRQFRETTRALVERVVTEVPEYRSIRNVLFRALVPFDVAFHDMNQDMQEHVSDKLHTEAWDFVSIGMALSEANTGIVAVKHRGDNMQNHLLRFGLPGGANGELVSTNSNFLNLFPTRDLHTALGHTTEGNLVLIALPTSGDRPIEEKTLPGRPLSAREYVCQITIDQQDIALIVRQEGVGTTVSWQEIDLEGQGGHLIDLPEDIPWSIWSVHAQSAMLLTAGQCGNHWHLLRMPIQRQTTNTGSNAPVVLATHHRNQTILPEGLILKHMVPLGRDQLLLIDSAGKLYYWSTTRHVGAVLPHPDWIINPDNVEHCIIQAGRGGWIAVSVDDYLSMWRISREGALSPFLDGDDSLMLCPFRQQTHDTLTTTSDGNYLLAVTEQTIPTWTFPHRPIDDLA